MNKPLRVLVVEDSEDDTLILLRELRRGGHQPLHERVDTAEAMSAALEKQEWDVVIADHNLPRFSSTAALALVQEKGIDLPFIILSGSIGEECAVAAMKAGAHDYVIKGNMARLASAVNRELREAAERKQRRQAEAVESLRDGLVHMVVHDMRNFLGAITAGLDLLKITIPSDAEPDAHNAIEMAYGNARTLTAMVNQLLDISRLEAGQMPLQKGQCDMVSMAHSAVKSLSSLLTGGRLIEIFPTNPVIAVCDPGIIGRVFTNLLSNAVKFTPEGGEVRVQIGRTGNAVRCSVTDTGPGIPPEYHRKIFDKFGQVESGNERGGVGLGLTFCKLALEAHGGCMGLESTLGKGSTFWFTLPAE